MSQTFLKRENIRMQGNDNTERYGNESMYKIVKKGNSMKVFLPAGLSGEMGTS